MSQLIGAALPVFILDANDVRNCDEIYFGNDDELFPAMLLDTTWNYDIEYKGFATPFWPACGGFADPCGFDNCLTGATRWADPWYALGANGRLGFVGYTRDQYGSAIGGCTVRCFNTATNELTAQVVSDSNGFYIATTPYADGHYLVVHKSGSPDIAGASISTLTPA